MLCGTNAATLMRFGRLRNVSRYSGNVSNVQWMPVLQRGHAHAFDEFERLHDELAVARSGRSDAEPAVALHDRGDTVPRRRREVLVPEDLRVEVRVDVDEPRTQHQPAEVDFGRAIGGGDFADCGDDAVNDLDVITSTRRTCSIDDSGVAQDEMHERSPSPAGRRSTRLTFTVSHRREAASVGPACAMIST